MSPRGFFPAMVEHHPLLGTIIDENDDLYVQHRQKPWDVNYLQRFDLTHRILMVIIVIQSLMLFTGYVAMLEMRTSQAHHRVLYSPALEVVENQVKVFHVGFGDYSSFQVPSSPELDRAWNDLYNFGISKIPKDQAAKLPNKTHAIPGDEGYYITELDVFHNLHCLNMVRKALDPGYYPNWDISRSKNASEHVSHCVDWIRQSIMCNADTSVIVWQWDDRFNSSIVKGNVAHTCRNFEKIQDWAKERILEKPYISTVKIIDDIVVPELQTHNL